MSLFRYLVYNAGPGKVISRAETIPGEPPAASLTDKVEKHQAVLTKFKAKTVAYPSNSSDPIGAKDCPTWDAGLEYLSGHSDATTRSLTKTLRFPQSLVGASWSSSSSAEAPAGGSEGALSAPDMSLPRPFQSFPVSALGEMYEALTVEAA